MILEIDTAVNFLLNIIRTTIQGQALTTEKILHFRTALAEAFQHRYNGHWFPDRPLRGSAYRCVRIGNSNLDWCLKSAATAVGFSESELRSLLPSDLTLWIDPKEVSYRFGEDGSVGVVYNERPAEDSNANTRLSSSPVQSKNQNPAGSVLLRNGSPDPADMRWSPDVVNQEFWSRCTHS